MAASLRIAVWHANVLSSHRLEFQTFLDMHQIDIALVSETHFTSRTGFLLPRYTVDHIITPDDTAHGVRRLFSANPYVTTNSSASRPMPYKPLPSALKPCHVP